MVCARELAIRVLLDMGRTLLQLSKDVAIRWAEGPALTGPASQQRSRELLGDWAAVGSPTGGSLSGTPNATQVSSYLPETEHKPWAYLLEPFTCDAGQHIFFNRLQVRVEAC